MNEDKKKPKIILGPAFQESVDAIMERGDPEEIAEFQAFMDSVYEMAENGTLQENSEPVDMDELQESDPELAEKLLRGAREARRAMGGDPDLEDAIAHFEEAKDAEDTPDAIRKNFSMLHQWLIELKGTRKKMSSLADWMKEMEEARFEGSGREAEWTMHLLRTLRERIGGGEAPKAMPSPEDLQ